MLKKMMIFVSVFVLAASTAMALPLLQETSGTITTLPGMDTFDDTLAYDDGQIALWYGGLPNFRLATRFSPLADFEMQQIMIAFMNAGPTPVDLYLKDDNNGLPGDSVIWSGTLLYTMPTTWLPVFIDTTGMYTFPAGEDFWIEVFSPGPPHEMFDNSATLPQRSYIKFSGSTLWSESPGDNFIRAIGEYAAVPNDVGVDSVWHDENFFVTNGSSFSVGARVTNYGGIPAVFDVGCVIYTEVGENLYTFFDSLTVQGAALIPGASQNLAFPTYTWNTDERYKIDVRTYWTQDSNPDNNIMSTETQVYTSPAELRYDDTAPDGGVTSSQADFGWGMKFDPHQAGEYTISSIKIYASVSDSVSRIQVLSDLGYAPGSVLWETISSMASGWNEFAVDITHTDAFFIFYLFESGGSSAALWRDGNPVSGQAWEKNGLIFSSDPTAQDWAMRATIEGGAGSPLFITMTPTSSTTIPPAGGLLEYNIAGGNNGSSSETMDIWADVTLPNGSTFGPVLGPVLDFTMPAGFSANRDRELFIPAGAPAGTYSLNGYFGEYDAVNPTVYVEDSFNFEKTGADGAWVGTGFVDSGESFEEVRVSDPGSIPVDYVMVQNYPNPFNPTTTIGFSIPETDHVQLSVFDVNGRLVAKLVDGYREAGLHEVTFDASQLSSGIYLYRLETGDVSDTGKMVLMK
jgi:hypothetical protein